MKTFRDLSFSEKIIRRNRILTGVLILMIIYMIVVGELGFGDSRMMSQLAENTSRIIFFGGMVYLIFKIRQNKKILNNQQLLKQKMIEENDEMNRIIYEKSGGAVWDILLICQLFITLTASLMNMAAFYASIISLGIMVIAKLASYLYLKRKFLN